MADIPGLIEGASEGAGLGIQFLKHLQRTRLLLHLVDIAPIDPNVEPAHEVRAIARELSGFSVELAEKPRWLVINKTDLLSDDDLAVARDLLLEEIDEEDDTEAVQDVKAEDTSDTQDDGGQPV